MFDLKFNLPVTRATPEEKLAEKTAKLAFSGSLPDLLEIELREYWSDWCGDRDCAQFLREFAMQYEHFYGRLESVNPKLFEKVVIGLAAVAVALAADPAIRPDVNKSGVGHDVAGTGGSVMVLVGPERSLPDSVKAGSASPIKLSSALFRWAHWYWQGDEQEFVKLEAHFKGTADLADSEKPFGLVVTVFRLARAGQIPREAGAREAFLLEQVRRGVNGNCLRQVALEGLQGVGFQKM